MGLNGVVAATVITVQVRVDQVSWRLRPQAVLDQLNQLLCMHMVAGVDHHRLGTQEQGGVGTQPTSLKKNQIIGQRVGQRAGCHEQSVKALEPQSMGVKVAPCWAIGWGSCN